MPRPQAGARARARFNDAKEAREQAGNEEFDPIGSPNEDKNAWTVPPMEKKRPLECR